MDWLCGMDTLCLLKLSLLGSDSEENRRFDGWDLFRLIFVDDESEILRVSENISLLEGLAPDRFWKLLEDTFLSFKKKSRDRYYFFAID